MQKLLSLAVLAALLVLPLAACAGGGPSLGGAQFSGATLPLPSNYRAIVAHAAASLSVASGETLGISTPATMFGVTAIDPKRWYVCLAGVKPPPSRTPPAGRYDTIVILEPIGPPGILHAYGSPFCTNASFTPLRVPRTLDATG